MDALEAIRAAVTLYTDVPAERVVPGAALAELDIDSLTFAELLFAIEDATGKELDGYARPATVADLTTLIEAAPACPR